MTKRLDVEFSFPIPDNTFDQGAILSKIKPSIDALQTAIENEIKESVSISTKVVTPAPNRGRKPKLAVAAE